MPTTRFNSFGATPTQLIAKYPGTVLADYDGGGTNGSAVITATLEAIAREVSSAFTASVYSQLTQVDCEEVVRYATDGQTTATVGMPTIAAGTLHLWAYPSLAALNGHTNGTAIDGGFEYDLWYRKPVVGYNELVLGTDYSISGSTITFIIPRTVGERIYASYDTDPANASYAMPSVADIVLLGSAGELGSRLYSEGTQEWKLVTQYAERYKEWLTKIMAGEWIPDEIRKLNYWTEAERVSSTEVTTVRRYRG